LSDVRALAGPRLSRLDSWRLRWPLCIPLCRASGIGLVFLNGPLSGCDDDSNAAEAHVEMFALHLICCIFLATITFAVLQEKPNIEIV